MDLPADAASARMLPGWTPAGVYFVLRGLADAPIHQLFAAGLDLHAALAAMGDRCFSRGQETPLAASGRRWQRLAGAAARHRDNLPVAADSG